MGSPYQQKVFQRKLIYIGAILVLLAGSWMWRHYLVAAQAQTLALREESLGEADLVGAATRLSLTGMRGFATCALWYTAMDRQKKNQWNELELIARSLTKLQPHFIAPWLFQGWNLAYNVSVEADAVNDRYFYISRGIALLGEGERQNHYQPRLRYELGYTYHHKIGLSDDTNALRSIFQLSLIPPNDRDPARFVKEDGRSFNWEEFEKFCKKHPQLVRRLRKGILRDARSERLRQFICPQPRDVVRFLADNVNVPSLFEEEPNTQKGAWQPKEDRLRRVTERFPLLPPRHDNPFTYSQDDYPLNAEESTLGDDVDASSVSGAWFCYAMEAVPPPGDKPGQSQEITGRNRARQHLPHMTTVLFRAYPAHMRRYTSERLEEEGWFDGKDWTIPDWFEDTKKTVKVGQGTAQNSGDAWERTFKAWNKYGVDNHLLFSDDAATQDRLERQWQRDAEKCRHKYPIQEIKRMTDAEAERVPEEDRPLVQAARYMADYDYYRNLSNFPRHLNRAYVESQKVTVLARKQFSDANELYFDDADSEGALRTFEKVLPELGNRNALVAWRETVLANRAFRDNDWTQENTFEIQLNYMRTLDRKMGLPLRKEVQKMAMVLPLVPPLAPAWNQKFFWAPILAGPFDGTAPDGSFYIPPGVRTRVLQRRHMIPTAPPPKGVPPGMRPPTSGGGPGQNPVPPGPPPMGNGR